MRSNLFVNADTKIHQAFCKLESGCFTTRTAVLDMTADLTGKTPKWDFAIDIANDGASVFKSDFVVAKESTGTTAGDDAEALKSLGAALNLKAKNMVEKARKVFLHALALSPNNARILNAFGEFLEEVRLTLKSAQSSVLL